MNPFNISYSARKLYNNCPKSYEFRYIRKEKGQPDPKNYMFGTIIGRVFEIFYRDRVWLQPDPIRYLSAKYSDIILEVYNQENYLKGTNPSYELNLRQDLEKFVPLGIETIRKHRLIKNRNEVELDLTIQVGSDDNRTRMVGRADFVLYDSPESFYILDGKASKHREKYVDSDQLIWYAVSHYIKYGVAPKQIGFVFWLFPEDPITFISYSSDDMRKVISDTNNVVAKIKNQEFTATTSGMCHKCSFKNLCEDGQRYISLRKKETGGLISESIFDLEVS